MKAAVKLYANGYLYGHRICLLTYQLLEFATTFQVSIKEQTG
jgi:hypothetical protein